ncbi:MAG TPA: DUF4266 domain-containing protein [Polyangiaceae bacterium]|nr:DUF4266 domain-containing protein [Polyangiaceae bacterium]
MKILQVATALQTLDRAVRRFGVGTLFWAGALIILLSAAGCATVRPEQRAVLADPIMQFDSEPGEQAARAHVLENREGALASGSIKGGGCGCN